MLILIYIIFLSFVRLKHNGKLFILIEVLSDVDFLHGAYQCIKSNPAVMAKG
jgi:hypothetical protein